MSKKKINKDSMSALIGGLVGSPVESEPEINEQEESPVSPTPTSQEVNTSRRGRPSGTKKEMISTTVDVEVMNKVRAIAKKEDLSITSLIEVGLRKTIKEYEEKNGPIRVRQPKKKNVDDLFSI